MVHVNIVKLFKVTTADTLSNNVTAKMILDATNFKSNTSILAFPLDDEMVVIHHINTTEDTIIERVVKHFGFFGGDMISKPFNLNPTDILTINEAKVFSWETLKKVITTVDVE